MKQELVLLEPTLKQRVSMYFAVLCLEVHKEVNSFITDTQAGMSAKSVILMGVAFFLLAVIFPIGMTQIVDANTTGWNAAVTTIFTILVPILAAIGIAVKFVPGARK